MLAKTLEVMEIAVHFILSSLISYFCCMLQLYDFFISL